MPTHPPTHPDNITTDTTTTNDRQSRRLSDQDVATDNDPFLKQLAQLKAEAERFNRLIGTMKKEGSGAEGSPSPSTSSTGRKRKASAACEGDTQAALSSPRSRARSNSSLASPPVENAKGKGKGKHKGKGKGRWGPRGRTASSPASAMSPGSDTSVRSSLRSPQGTNKRHSTGSSSKKVRMTVEVPGGGGGNTPSGDQVGCGRLGSPRAGGGPGSRGGVGNGLLSPRRRTASDGDISFGSSRKRSQSYDIDEVVSPYMRRSVQSVQVIEHREILVPRIDIIDESDSKCPSDESSGEECTDNDTYMGYHHPLESKERLLVVPNGNSQLAAPEAPAMISGLSRAYFDLQAADDLARQVEEEQGGEEGAGGGDSGTPGPPSTRLQQEQSTVVAAVADSGNSFLFPNRPSPLTSPRLTSPRGHNPGFKDSARRRRSTTDLGSPTSTPRRTINNFAFKFERNHRHMTSKSYVPYEQLSEGDQYQVDLRAMGGPNRFVGWLPRSEWSEELDQIPLHERTMWQSHDLDLECNKTSVRNEPPMLETIEEGEGEGEGEASTQDHEGNTTTVHGHDDMLSPETPAGALESQAVTSTRRTRRPHGQGSSRGKGKGKGCNTKTGLVIRLKLPSPKG
eukprot:TRINITY_DN1963_c1_g3_i2.p1 TRINITY_DN1963_c1_g3~~TRINITY_DN1963_c1_g3_i2.p1  ORF type:complete len:624 (-),score=103.21 TRINITY_DN1963_c1_g3_i2:52-1923(-)